MSVLIERKEPDVYTLYRDNTLHIVDAGAVEHSGVWIREHGDRGGNPDGGNTGVHSVTVTRGGFRI